MKSDISSLLIKSTASIFTCLLLTACGNDQMGDLHSFVNEVKSRKAGRITPLPEIKSIETFLYTASDRRNPFAFSMEEEPEAAMELPDNGIRPDTLRRKEELEDFPLDSLRMVGTIERSEITWGLIRSQEGTIYRIQADNYMGQNHGRITRILEDRIELIEIVPDGQTGYVERPASLSLSDDE